MKIVFKRIFTAYGKNIKRKIVKFRSFEIFFDHDLRDHINHEIPVTEEEVK